MEDAMWHRNGSLTIVSLALILCQLVEHTDLLASSIEHLNVSRLIRCSSGIR